MGTRWSNPDNRWMYGCLNEGDREKEIQGWPCGGAKFTLHLTGSQNKPLPIFIKAPRHNHHNSGLSQNKSSCAGSVRKCVCLPATARAVHQRLLTTFYPEYNAPCVCVRWALSQPEHTDRFRDKGGERKKERLDRSLDRMKDRTLQW